MSSHDKAKSLVKTLLGKFESSYKRQWEEERFGVFPQPCETKHGKLDFDTIFYWKVYAQGYFAMQSGYFFSTLANRKSGGPAMIRHLASLSPYRDRLLASEGLFDDGMKEAIRAGRPGWKVLGYAVTASQRLAGLYPEESQSYVAQWLSDCLLNKAWDGRWERLVESLNTPVEHLLDPVDPEVPLKTVLQLRDFIVNTFVFPSGRHLTGVGPEMLSFFLRDWKDFAGWPYFWKHDTRNQAFWRMVAQRQEFGLGSAQMEHVVEFLAQNLEAAEVRDGALAKINTTVYRFHKDLGEEKIRQQMRNCSLCY